MITVAITFYENRRMLDLCLERLVPTLAGHDTEIIVVNDNPEQPLVLGTPFRSAVRLVRVSENLGYSGACNLAVEAARGTLVLFLDCDIVVAPGWIEALLRSREACLRAGAISAKILDLSHGGIAHFGAAMHEVDSIHPYQENAATYHPTCIDREFQLMVSGAMLTERALFRELGGFDLRLRNAFGDFDLALKMTEIGRPPRVCSESVVYHRGTVSGNARYVHYADAKALFFRRWGGSIRNDGLDFLAEACLPLREQMPARPFLAVNLSSSLFANDYIDAAADALGVRVTQRHSVSARERNAPHVRFEDRLDWQTCRLKVPFLYFVDRFTAIRSNHYWFAHRGDPDDLVVDRNGNVFLVRMLRDQEMRSPTPA